LRGTAQDITDRKRIEEALASTNRRVIEAEERERSRIAMDLHEDIGQRLTLLAIEIERLGKYPANEPADLFDRMHAVRKQTLNILTDVKASAHELHSPRLDYLDIATVMKCFCKEFGERKRVEIDFRNEGQRSLVPPDVSICLFRILQEALYNGVKHSEARRFEVRWWETLDELHLTIGDSGIGFDVEEARKGSGLGLIRMEQAPKTGKGCVFD
jgi:signal transduction histidine kinase